MFKKLTFEYNVFMDPFQNQSVEITSDNWILSVNGEKLFPEKAERPEIESKSLVLKPGRTITGRKDSM